MNSKQNIPDYLKPYQEAVKKYGGTFDATLWRSREGQVLRFKSFTSRIDFNRVSILDIGCGVGDFAQFLIESDLTFDRFHGIDAMEPMIETAQDRNLSKCTFETCDVVTRYEIMLGYDWITCSGTLNAMKQSEATDLIDAAFQACYIGVAFNFLSNQSGRDASSENLDPASRFDTNAMLAFSFTLTPLVEFTQAYLGGHDATIILTKHEVPQ